MARDEVIFHNISKPNPALDKLGVSEVILTKDFLTVYNGNFSAQAKHYVREIAKTCTELDTNMVDSGHFGDRNQVSKIIMIISDMWSTFLEGKHNDKEESKNVSTQHHQTYFSDNLMAEAIMINGLPYFLVAVYSVSPKDLNKAVASIVIKDLIKPDKKTIIKPDVYGLSMQYNFKSKEQCEELISSVQEETLDTLYRKVKSIWKKYVSESDAHIEICSANTIFTYYQDKIGITHYLFFIGEPDSGKSSNLTVLHFLSYRNVLSTDMTPANIYSCLGDSRHEGLGTLSEDEADNIVEDRDKMRIYKSGYTTGKPVLRHREDSSSGDKKQHKLNTFCFKAFAAEKSPDSENGKGFNERCIFLPCTYSFPDYDISEIANPSGDEIDEQLLNELHDVRNALLIFRLSHHSERIPNIRLNLQNREKQLFKPLLRVFQDTKTFDDLRAVLSTFVNARRQDKGGTLSAFLWEVIDDLAKRYKTGNATLDNKIITLKSTVIWNEIKERLKDDGEAVSKYSFNSVEYGELSQKSIVTLLKDHFGARAPKHVGSERELCFNPDKLQKMGYRYNLTASIQVITEPKTETYETHYAHCSDADQNSENQNSKEVEENSDKPYINSNKTDKNELNITIDNDAKEAMDPHNAVNVSHVSQTTRKHIPLRKGSKWGCKRKSCLYSKVGGDSFELRDTECNGVDD